MNLKTVFLRFFLQPRKSTLIGGAIPAVDYEGAFGHKIMVRQHIQEKVSSQNRLFLLPFSLFVF